MTNPVRWVETVRGLEPVYPLTRKNGVSLQVAERIEWFPGFIAGTQTKYARVDGVDIFEEDARKYERIVEGWASTGAPNSHNYALDPKGCKIKFPIPVLSSHGRLKGSMASAHDTEAAAIGEVLQVRRSAQGIWVRCAIWDTPAGDAAWANLESGRYKAFSGAADRNPTLKGIVDGVRYYSQWRLKEVSVCPTGACPGALIERHWVRS